MLKSRRSTASRLYFGMLLSAVGLAAADPESKVKVDDSSFKCITEMTKVRHFTTTCSETLVNRLLDRGNRRLS